MNLKFLFDKYKEQPVFKIAMVMFIITVLIKTAILGYEFGQWLKVR